MEINYLNTGKAEKIDLDGKMESVAAKRYGLATVVAYLKARLKESKDRLKESELRVAKEREASRELEEELLLYKKEAMEQHEKGF